MAPLLAALLPTVTKIIGQIIPDPAARDEAAFKLAELVQNGKFAEIAGENKMFELEVADKNSARQREIQTGDHTTRYLAYLYTVGFFVVLGGQFYLAVKGIELPVGAQRTIDLTTGVLFAMVYASKDYYFGTTHSSSKKTDIIARASPVKD